MIRQCPSIFNDILGPVMVGPSSSHTCAPSRIGYLCRQLLPGTLKKATIQFAQDGAYTKMYKGQRSDLGFINGLLGRRPEDPRLKNAYQDAEKSGVEVEFVIKDFLPIVPNLSHVILENTKGDTVTIYTDSTGGGTVKLFNIEGYDVEILGDCYELVVLCQGDRSQCEKTLASIEVCFDSNEGTSCCACDGKGLLNLKRRVPFLDSDLEKIKQLPGLIWVRVIDPILLVPSNRNATLPFHSAAELISAAHSEKKELWELAIDYEMARSGWSRKEILNQMEYIVRTMEAGVREALTGKIDMNGILSPTAGKIKQFVDTDTHSLNMGVINAATAWAMATMEYSSSMGVVFCAPTGGSAGIFPGAILGVMNEFGCTIEEKVKALLVTAVLGVVISKDCNYSAELYGCQVEPGAASAMAAGGLVWYMGGTPEQSCQAASCAIQNILGTICDPVAGLVQLPCINRNAMSAANSVVCANMIMGGFDPLIPLDEAAETLFRVGKMLPSELRCTCRGGLCTTPCGERLALEQESRNNADTL